ncbi:GTP-binding protein [Kitasatospora sp. NPDC050463]|uniref:GTP-binding protein n=1 Tax=Kitasatospora sp. NPDC050463 TaxID=3155786 RepID=UPI0033ED89C7
MSAVPGAVKLPVVVVAGLHRAERRRAVQELLDGCVNAVVLHHDLRDAGRGTVHRELRDGDGPYDTAELPLAEDCACCALREDLLPELAGIAEAGRHGLAIVELWGGSDPHPAVEVIAGGEADGRPMEEVVELAGVVVAVDPDRLIGELSVSDDLVEHGEHTSPDDARTRAEALAHQIEYATTVAVADRGKVRSRRVTRLTVQQQRAVSRAIKNAREMALLPYTSTTR